MLTHEQLVYCVADERKRQGALLSDINRYERNILRGYSPLLSDVFKFKVIYADNVVLVNAHLLKLIDYAR